MANIPMARICFFPSPGRYREGIAFAIAASDEIFKIQGILSRGHFFTIMLPQTNSFCSL